MILYITKIYKPCFALEKMGTVLITTKVMPDSPSADLSAIKAEAKSRLEKEGGKNLTFEEKPVAFGLKSLHIKVEFPEEKGSDFVEVALSSIPHVSSAVIEDYRRAFG